MKTIGLIVATIEELQATGAVLQEKETVLVQGGLEFIKGYCGAHDVVLVKAGIGKVNAALCTQMLLDRFDPDWIINVGVAGGLTGDLYIGDIVISQDTLQHDFDTTFFGDAPGYISGVNRVEFPADPALIGAAQKACEELGLRYRLGRIVSGDQFIADAVKKDHLRDDFGGTCTEMEGAAVAQVCYVNRKPFVVLRAISDGAGDGANMQYGEFVMLAAKNAAQLLIHLPEEI